MKDGPKVNAEGASVDDETEYVTYADDEGSKVALSL